MNEENLNENLEQDYQYFDLPLNQQAFETDYTLYYEVIVNRLEFTLMLLIFMSCLLLYQTIRRR